MKEIGGYIELDEIDGNEFHNNAIALNSGRHCLEYIIKARKINKLFIPYFLCATIKDTCEKCNCNYEYYNIDKDFSVIFEKELLDNEYIYIVNYYGQISKKKQKMYKQKYKNIIFDNVQAFFETPMKDVDTIYSCRKFFGVSDGSYLYTDKKLEYELDIDKSFERIKYVLGRYEVDAETFFKDASLNNDFFDNEDMKFMSKLTHNLLRRINYKKISTIRTTNFKYLNDNLHQINKLNLTIPVGAFMYPLYVNNSEILRKELIKEKIYVPTLWKDVYDITDKNYLEWDFSENIVPIPCDQRYSTKDMDRIIKIIRGVINE